MTKINFVNGQPPALNDDTLNQLQTNIENAITQAILEDNKKKYYVGKIVMDTANVNPATYLGFGTWQYWGAGRVPVGVDASDSDFNAVEKTGGEKTHKLTVAEMPEHDHDALNYTNGYAEPTTGQGSFSQLLAGDSASTNYVAVKNSGGDQAHNNVQPYITCYMWKRVA